MPETFQHSGYRNDQAYQQRQPDWERDDRYESVDAALEAAQSWVADADHQAIVEVIRVEGSRGEVTHVVSIGDVEAV